MNIESIVLSSYLVTLVSIGIISTIALLTGLSPPQKNYKQASFFFASAVGIPPLIGSFYITLQTPYGLIYNLFFSSIMFFGTYFFQIGYTLRSQKKLLNKYFILIHYLIYILGIIILFKTLPTDDLKLIIMIFKVSNFVFIGLLMLPVVRHISHTKSSYGEIANYLSICATIILMLLYPIALHFSQSNQLFLWIILPLQVVQVHIWVITILVLVLSDLVELYELQAKTDGMTQLANREYFLEQAIELCIKYKKTYIVFCDIDYFKSINDTYGHKAGDRVIINFTKLLKNNLPVNNATVGRIGGEEFAICIANKELDFIVNFTKSLCAKTENLEVIHEQQKIYFTASFGISIVKNDFEDALKRADESLYIAKRSGRNQVHMYIDHADKQI